jgi:hypothetical protein
MGPITGDRFQKGEGGYIHDDANAHHQNDHYYIPTMHNYTVIPIIVNSKQMNNSIVLLHIAS